jgi:hypothetical protein
MMNCQKVERIVARYVVGTLPPWSRIAVVRHLDQCGSCRLLVESHYRVAFLVDSLPGDEPPAGLWNAVFNEIAEETPGRSPMPVAHRDWKPSVAVAAAGLAVGVVLGQLMGNPMPSLHEASNITPVIAPNVATYVQQHGRLASEDPLTDQVSLAAYITAASRDNQRMEGNFVRR